MKLIISLIIFSLFISCSIESPNKSKTFNSDTVLDSTITEESKKLFILEFDSSYYNRLASETIDKSLLAPEKTTLRQIKEHIGHGGGRISQGIIEGNNFAYYPTTINYELYGIDYFMLGEKGDTISNITILENSDVYLASGIVPFRNTKKEIETIYGMHRVVTTKHQKEKLNYNELGIIFNFKENQDTVQDISIFQPYVNKLVNYSPSEYLKPFNPPTLK